MLNIDAMICRMGKISNNLEKHGDEDVPEFNIPIEGIMLTAEQLNAFVGDAHADRAWFDDERGLRKPMPWCAKNTISHNERYDSATAKIKFVSDEEVGFENCRLDKITLAPQIGGLTRMDFTLQLTPGLGRENLLLQEHQRHEITLSIADAKVALKKSKDKQQSLPLETTSKAQDGDANGDDHPEPDAQNEPATTAEMMQRRDEAEANRQLSEAAAGLAQPTTPKKRGRKGNSEARAH